MVTGTQKFKHLDSGDRGKGHPIMFGFKEADLYTDFPCGGGYPKRFLTKAFQTMGVTDPTAVLHVCSGSLRSGICVDIRPATNPTIVADARCLPFRDNTFEYIMCDPPYSREYAENLYQTGAVYPSPHGLVNECIRVLRPGGRLGFMHHMVPKVRKPGKILAVYGITQGLGYNIRAWTLLTKLV